MGDSRPFSRILCVGNPEDRQWEAVIVAVSISRLPVPRVGYLGLERKRYRECLEIGDLGECIREVYLT